jgi:hypothetical protein
MTYFIGNVGNVRLRRNNEIVLSALVKDADVTVVLNRVGFEGAVDNLLTGDRVTISTADHTRAVVLHRRQLGGW